MNKVIINNRTGVSDEDSLRMVLSVIGNGKISETRGKECYCLCTVIGSHVVLASLSKRGTDTFTILPESLTSP